MWFLDNYYLVYLKRYVSNENWPHLEYGFFKASKAFLQSEWNIIGAIVLSFYIDANKWETAISRASSSAFYRFGFRGVDILLETLGKKRLYLMPIPIASFLATQSVNSIGFPRSKLLALWMASFLSKTWIETSGTKGSLINALIFPSQEKSKPLNFFVIFWSEEIHGLC